MILFMLSHQWAPQPTSKNLESLTKLDMLMLTNIHLGITSIQIFGHLETVQVFQTQKPLQLFSPKPKSSSKTWQKFWRIQKPLNFQLNTKDTQVAHYLLEMTNWCWLNSNMMLLLMKLSITTNKSQEKCFITWKNICSEQLIGNLCPEDYGTEEKE